MSDLTYAALIEAQICRLVKRTLGLRVNEVRRDHRLIDDLGCDSLHLVEIPNAIEDLYEIEISDDETGALVTVADLIAIVDRKLREAGR